MEYPPTYPRDSARRWDIMTFGREGCLVVYQGVAEDWIRAKATETIGSFGTQHFAVARSGGQNYQFSNQSHVDYWWPAEIFT